MDINFPQMTVILLETALAWIARIDDNVKQADEQGFDALLIDKPFSPIENAFNDADLPAIGPRSLIAASTEMLGEQKVEQKKRGKLASVQGLCMQLLSIISNMSRCA